MTYSTAYTIEQGCKTIAHDGPFFALNYSPIQNRYTASHTPGEANYVTIGNTEEAHILTGQP